MLKVRIAPTPKVPPTITVTIAPPIGRTLTNGPSHELGRARAKEAPSGDGMVLLKLVQAVAYPGKID